VYQKISQVFLRFNLIVKKLYDQTNLNEQGIKKKKRKDDKVRMTVTKKFRWSYKKMKITYS